MDAGDPGIGAESVSATKNKTRKKSKEGEMSDVDRERTTVDDVEHLDTGAFASQLDYASFRRSCDTHQQAER